MRLPVLTYHAVLPVDRAADVRGTVPLAVFRDQVAWLVRKGFTALTLDQAADLLEGRGAAPSRPIVLTFDDGYRCVVEHALEVLADAGLTATLFVVTDMVDRTSDWYEAKGGPRFEHASWAELERARRAGFAVESHGVTHRRLNELNAEEAVRELEVSRAEIERRLDSCRHFAYPFGAAPRDLAVVRSAGYRTAATTDPGFNRAGQALHALRRQNVGRTTTPGRFRRRAGALW